MKTETRQEIETRIREIKQQLGLCEPSEGPPLEHNLEEMEDLYAELERLLQELKQDC